jgi:hypothetical protein
MAGDITGQPDPVTDDDAAPAEFPRFHRRHRAIAEPAPVAAAVHARHERVDGILVRRAPPGAGSRTPARPDPHIVLVQPCVAAGPAQGACPSICSHRLRNSGNVLLTVSALRTRKPGTTSPSTAAAITSRWSL